MQSFQDPLRDLATITQNRIRIAPYSAEYNKTTTPTDYTSGMCSNCSSAPSSNHEGTVDRKHAFQFDAKPKQHNALRYKQPFKYRLIVG